MKTKLLAAFAEELKTYPWASDEAKLANFIAAAEKTLNGGGNLINRDGPAFKAALAKCGLPARITLQALHELPA